jgi:hypothetical protein
LKALELNEFHGLPQLKGDVALKGKGRRAPDVAEMLERTRNDDSE